jgi:hypothetical protein
MHLFYFVLPFILLSFGLGLYVGVFLYRKYGPNKNNDISDRT